MQISKIQKNLWKTTFWFIILIFLIHPVLSQNISQSEQMDKGLFTGVLNTLSSAKSEGDNTIEDLLAQGERLLSNNSFLEATSAFEKILLEDPESPEGWLGLARAQSGLGNNDEALDSVDESLFRDSGSWQGYLLRGSILTTLSRYPEAVSSYEQALNINETDPVTWNGYGVALYWNGSYDLSLKALNQSLAIQPENPSAYYWEGLVHLKQENSEAALSSLNRSLSLDSHFVEVYLVISDVYEQDNQYDNALSVIASGIDNNLASFPLWKKKGLILEELRRENEASDAYRKALVLYPNDTEVTLRLSQITGGSDV